jgi:hypothetical protein
MRRKQWAWRSQAQRTKRPHPITPLKREQPERLCVACGRPAWEGNRLLAVYLDVELVHQSCLISPALQAWEEARRAADPAYDRWCVLMRTLGHRFACPHCGASLALWPKAGGNMGTPYWAMGCLNCHRTGPGALSAFDGTAETQAVFGPMLDLKRDFALSRDLDRIARRVAELARQYDHRINPEPCACGGRFSLSAKPRCPRCDVIAFDSYFHEVYEPSW